MQMHKPSFRNPSKNTAKNACFCFFVAVSLSKLFAFATQDEYSLGLSALHYTQKPRVWFRVDVAAIDGQRRTLPPGTIYYDRRVESLVALGGEGSWDGGRFGLRMNMRSFTQTQKAQEKLPPRSPRESKRQLGLPSLDVIYITPKGLELTAGVQSRFYLSDQSTTRSEVADSSVTLSPLSLHALGASLLRRGGQWNGGFYYIQGSEAARRFVKESSDGTVIEGLDFVHIPSEYGLVADFALANTVLELDMAMVQAGGGGERTSNGNTIADDYLRGALSLSVGLAAEVSAKFGLSHQTLSYADHAYASVDSMPISSVRAQIFFGQLSHAVVLGAIYAYGKDGADITEYKARFKLQAVALRGGLAYAW